MKRLVVMVVAAGAALAAEAMPTKAELQKAQTMVNDVTAADVAALKAKSKTPAEVAAKHMELAGQAGNEAEKYLLLQGAFKLYAKAGDYDAAANVIEKLQTEIADYDPEVTVELCGAEFIRKMRENAPRLYALKENARRIVFYRKQLPIREAAVGKNPRDQQAQRKLAECHAELGDWPKALDVFVKAGGEFKKMAEGETSGKIPAQELGDFWWDYETKSDTQVYKLHAAELYRKALADGSFKGLARTRAEQRVKEVAEDGSVLPTVAASAAQNNGGGNGAAAPANISNCTFDLGCERKLEMIACPAGTFTMGEKTVAGDCNEVRKHQVKITHPFWLSKVAVTVAQWERISNGRIVGETDDLRFDFPKQNTAIWHKRKFMEKLNELFASQLPKGYVFRMPTEAELAYAMTSGGRDKITGLSIGVLGPSLADKEKVLRELTAKGAKLKSNERIRGVKVGLAKANAWGFYDVINNGEQSVLDRVAPSSRMRKLKCGEKDWIVDISYSATETDPLCWDEGEKGVKCLCCDQDRFWGRHTHDGYGWNETFRVCLGPDLIAEKKAKDSTSNAGGSGSTQVSDDIWTWVIPTKTYAGWKVSKTQPDSKWIFADCKASDNWAGGIGYTMIPHGDSSNRRWMRAEVEWRGDLQKIEAAELVYRINDHATVWINGIEIASRISAGGEYASKDITAEFKATFKNAVKTPVCVEVVNTHGGGGGDVGIRVKMRK